MSTLQNAIRVEALFSDIDVHAKQFAAESKLTCPVGCGRCCENPDIETTVIDMLPLAVHLKDKGRLDEVAMSLPHTLTDACVFFEKHAGEGGGRCTVYRYRPSICRLFGFAASRDKNQNPILAACKVHKQSQPEVVENAKREVEARRLNPPLFSTYAGRLDDIDPVLANRHYPINVALLLAIEKIALLPS